MSDSAILGRPELVGEPPIHVMTFAPEGEARARVLIVTPLFDEKRCAHRALVACARALATAGAEVRVPDLTGTGNSGGSVGEVTLAQWEADVRATAASFVASEKPLVVVACRAGVLVAVSALSGVFSRLVLLQPVMSGRGYLQQARLRRKMQDEITGGAGTQAGPTEIEGEALSPELFSALQALKLEAPPDIPTLKLVQCGANDRLQSEYARLAAGWGEEHLVTRALVHFPFWQAHSPAGYEALAAAVCEEALA